jgi:DinB superfamily
MTDTLRDELLHMLRGGGAHPGFEAALAGLPAKLRGARCDGLPHTPWRLLEHVRLAQWDILEFCRNPAHVSPPWPAGYWPEGDAPPDARAWSRSAAAFRADLEGVAGLVESADLFAPVPDADGPSLLREVLLVADHNAYHAGQLVALRRALGAWSG